MALKKTPMTNLVYSSETGRICPGCGKPVAGCSCRKPGTTPPSDGIVRVGRETKGRKGKGVTIITGVPLPSEELKELAGQLKKRCGTGGTIKDGVIEIQGDQRELIIALLQERGWKVKRTGG